MVGKSNDLIALFLGTNREAGKDEIVSFREILLHWSRG